MTSSSLNEFIINAGSPILQRFLCVVGDDARKQVDVNQAVDVKLLLEAPPPPGFDGTMER